MTPLPIEFEGRADQKSFRFRQLQRTATHALYEKTLKSSGRVSDYEVIEIQHYKACTRVIQGRTIECEAKEAFPSPEQWGQKGWSLIDLPTAKKRFYEKAGL